MKSRKIISAILMAGILCTTASTMSFAEEASEEEVTSFFKEIMPGIAEQLSEMKLDDPEHYAEIMDQAKAHLDEYARMIEQVANFLREKVPEALDHLENVFREDPAEYMREIAEIGEKIEHYQRIREFSPETADAILKSHRLELKSWKVAEKIAQAEDAAKRDKLVADLKEMLNEIFDARLKEGELEIAHLSQEIQDIRDALNRRKANRDRIVQNRYDQMVSEADEALRWW